MMPYLCAMFGQVMFLQTGGGGSLMQWLFLPACFLVFYFLLIRPQRRMEAEHKALLAGLKKDDEVVTQGGFFGKVHSIEADTDRVVIEIDPNKNVRMRIKKSSVVQVLSPADSNSNTNPKG